MKKAGNTWIPDGDEYFGPFFAVNDVFESKNLETALRFVKNKGTAIDCGAHVGSWTRAMAKVFEKVIAFEPHPDNFECLKANTDGLGNVELRNVGLARNVGYGELQSGTNSGCWHLGRGIRVQLETLPVVPVDFLKVDVEGFEYEVLRGGEEAIKKYRPVILMEEKNLPHKPLTYDARDFLEDMGYRQLAKSGRDVILGFQA